MGDAELPQDLITVLPTDPYEQLDIARKITSMAVSVRVSGLEAETDKLRRKLTETEGTICDLQQHVGELEQSLQKTTDQLSQAMVVQAKLINEKNTLTANVNKLTRDVTKLETFKRTLMQSLQDDDEKDDSDKAPAVSNSSFSAESLNVRRTDINSSTRISSLQSAAELATPSVLPDTETTYNSEAKTPSQKPSTTTPSHLTPQLTPTGSPSQRSAAGSPLQLSASGSPRWQSNSDARLSLSSSQSTSQHTTTPSSPPPLKGGSAQARTPRVDGKEFFRQARNRLSYEQFSTFLSIIKDLNAHRQTQEETLRKAVEIFGSENKDLYEAFNGLLSRHLPT